MRYFLLLTATVLLLGSCVPNRKVMYLQKGDVNKKELPNDTVVRKYNVKIDDYRIQPLDILSIRIESLSGEDFDFFSKLYPFQNNPNGQVQPSTGFLVDGTGNIEFPVVGKVNFGGLTVFQAQDTLKKVFTPYLKDPVARVQLMNFRFTILGEVIDEQQVVSTNTRVTVMEAIGMAGGLTDLADRRNVKIIRQKGSETEVFYVDLLSENLLNADHYYMQQNDVVIVPPLRQRPFRKYWGENLALFVSTVSLVLLTIELINND